MTPDTDLQAQPGPDGFDLVWVHSVGEQATAVLATHEPVILESVGSDLSRPERVARRYEDVEVTADRLRGTVEITDSRGAVFAVEDCWEREAGGCWRVDRRVQVRQAAPGTGARFLLQLSPQVGTDAQFADFHYFAPGAMYDLNDLNGDHVDDYVDSQTLLYREDRLSAMSVLAHHAATGLAISLSRADVPEFDPAPERVTGQTVFLQRTDIGSLGVQPGEERGCVLAGAYPFVERERSHALLVSSRPGWGAYWPVTDDEDLAVSYRVGISVNETPHESLWELWTRRMVQLDPVPVRLDATLDVITAHRLDALLDYYVEDDASSAAGFVTNCHPQDGRQLSNVIQYGFTGQNVLNAFNLLRAPAGQADGRDMRRRALRVVDFFVRDAQRSPHGFVHGLYNMDLGRYDSWWTGLLLPLAYAEPGDDLEALMGPLYDHLLPVIERLRGRQGVYLRCVAEEYDSILQAYAFERENGHDAETWLAAAESFGKFLVSAQQADGSWYRAYDLDGNALTEPDFWFGQTDVQRKSSTATVVPFLLRLHALTGREAFATAANRACDYIDAHFVAGLKFNGGIHDSMYAKPQLVDHESIIFAFRALLETYKVTGERRRLDAAVSAAWIVCTWVWLWDVPLPEGSTLAGFDFRSTGWTGCDAPGAGYVHPMGVVVVPDLVEIARLSGDDTFLKVAELILAGCNENVAVPAKSWGYARSGLQEEGVLVSWCWADDPMFAGTGFGGRGKGEGNKTCFPWISAVSVWAYQELLSRYGTVDVRSIRPRTPTSAAS